MLTFFGSKQRFCDGVSRRNFLKVGALATGGLTLADLFRLEAQAGIEPAAQVDHQYLPGRAVRRTWTCSTSSPMPRPSSAASSGPSPPMCRAIEICELMPKLAKVGDKFAIIRSVTGVRDEHSPRQSDSGWSENDLRSIGGHPGLGPVVSRVYGIDERHRADRDRPVRLHRTRLPAAGLSRFPARRPGPLEPAAQQQHDVPSGSTDRKSLLDGLDRIRREVDQSGAMTRPRLVQRAGHHGHHLRHAGRSPRHPQGRPARARPLRHGASTALTAAIATSCWPAGWWKRACAW